MTSLESAQTLWWWQSLKSLRQTEIFAVIIVITFSVVTDSMEIKPELFCSRQREKEKTQKTTNPTQPKKKKKATLKQLLLYCFSLEMAYCLMHFRRVFLLFDQFDLPEPWKLHTFLLYRCKARNTDEFINLTACNGKAYATSTLWLCSLCFRKTQRYS